MQPEAWPVRLNGLEMHLRRSEIESVAAGLAEMQPRLDPSNAADVLTLVEVVRQLPPNDRAPAWELAGRHFGRHTPLAQAAGQIGMDLTRARALVERFSVGLAAVPPEPAS